MIPGHLISMATFPGVMIHELGHELLCYWTKTKVIDVCYFQTKDPPGFVIHEEPSSVWKHILIGFGPLLINTCIGLIIGFSAAPLRNYTGPKEALYMICIWFGGSIAMHSFPSTGDAKSIWQAVWGPKSTILARIIGTPLVAIIYLGSVGSIFWLDLAYGAGVVIGIPALYGYG